VLGAPSELAPALERLLRERQAERLPSVAAAVVRDGEIVWSGAVGSASFEEGREATPETQYRIGSITKTFTTAAIMQLRDEGKLDLDDRLEQHLEGVGKPTPTIRRMLAHLSGLQREVGEMWITGASPTTEELLDVVRDAELVLEPAQAHHYSNLAFATLGEVVARLAGVPYVEYVDERIIKPLGLEGTTWREQEPYAQGYLVDEFAGTVWRERHDDLAGVAAAGQLWSTVLDLCRWVSFLAAGKEGVLDPATAESMWFPQVMPLPDKWVRGWGLGLMLYSRDGKIWGGHGGAMAGHLAGAYVERTSKTGAAALTNSGTRGDMDELAMRLGERTLELWPEEIEPWRPEPEPPADVRPLLGRWWSEGGEFVFWWERGVLNAVPASLRGQRPAAELEPQGDGTFRVARGYEAGERLRVDGDRLIWGGYAFTRDQRPFAELDH
jgi:CubicO group peptidase (beta-lactamase class C family)